MFKEICINNKSCELMKAVNNPKYGSKSILTDSSWEYVALFLKRQSTAGASDALLYWEQAHNFYLSSLTLPDSARPLTSYYCILNASKALLRYINVDNSLLKNHGISSIRSSDEKTNLREAQTAVKGAGVLPELGKYYNCSLKPDKYNIAEILYNIPCIHRAYCITYSKPEIFIPIERPVFVKKDGSKEAWIKCSIFGRYANTKSLKSISKVFEQDDGVSDAYILRKKKRFSWDIHQPIEDRKYELNKYHEGIRKHFFYIYGENRLWYIKKDISGNDCFSHVPSPILIFCVFHWLSELVRYDPPLFKRYMKSKQNWLIHEFIHNALDQFVDEIGCEITGQDIMCTGCRK